MYGSTHLHPNPARTRCDLFIVYHVLTGFLPPHWRIAAERVDPVELFLLPASAAEDRLFHELIGRFG